MAPLLSFLLGFTWGISVAILVFWGWNSTKTFSEHWQDAATLLEDEQ